MDSKNFAAKVKAAGPADGLEDGQFLAYASVFGNVDSYGDVVQKGAFAGSLKEWTDSGDVIPTLWGHDTYDPFSNIGGVIEASEDDHGLLVKGQLDLTNPKAEQVYKLMKGRRINQLSFAYDILDAAQEVVDGENTFQLKALKLYEVSIVPMGANQETEILAVKSNARALVDGIKEGRVLASKHIDSLRAAQEAIGAVILAAEGEDETKASASEPVAVITPDGEKSAEPMRTTSATTRLLLDLEPEF